MRDTVRAVGLAAALLGWSATAPRLPQEWNPLPHMVFSGAVTLLSRPSLGLRPAQLRRGVRWGSAAAAPVGLGVAAGLMAPAVRAGMAARDLPAAPARWLLLRIPFATVGPEELAYRAVLGDAATRAFGPRVGKLFTAVVFGLSHVPDARAAGDNVPGTVVVTGAAGWVFSWLHESSGSLAAPVLAHLAVNEAGAVAALAVQQRRSGRGRPTGAAR
ncbi:MULTISPECIES: Rv0804 family intramembrane glutamic endopeptidase [Mycolicibacterium]|uniref:CAAX amino terminal protease family n=2 Tax=Mycolicibacterium gilvum TaxID=1804 RepID=E6TF54_MYCSR|nr:MULTISPECIES: CPBP family intramembrane glutamic endopeptidase [Mycolicibacterium]ABP44114.1 Abortive infection protein [Mycolicibacterium gilvum PYR-GCK]ADT97707.1 CAAX amino terminal protease family [Mycolicibacterium gilvum Spyr1]MBV5245588.1 CPBP family intramembrane metalloprotease [Mycolicibacterium sp. PAM1]